MTAMLSPDNQRNSWYLWVANQSGHAAIVGIALGGALIWLPPLTAVALAAAAYFLVWEWGYQIVTLGSKLYRDAIADTLNVAFGAGLAVTNGVDFWATWGAWLVVLAIGAGYRR